jgi:hypothetical protein
LYGIASQVFFMFKPILGSLGKGYQLIKIAMLYCFILNTLIITFAQQDIAVVIWADILAVLIASLYGLLKVRSITGLCLMRLGKDMLTIAIAALLMSVIIYTFNVYILTPLGFNPLLDIVLKVIVGMASYVFLFRLLFKNHLISKIQPLLNEKSQVLFRRILFLY